MLLIKSLLLTTLIFPRFGQRTMVATNFSLPGNSSPEADHRKPVRENQDKWEEASTTPTNQRSSDSTPGRRGQLTHYPNKAKV